MNKTVIDLLNQARARELAVISQYMIQHYELEDKDYGKLASKMKEIAIAEMKQPKSWRQDPLPQRRAYSRPAGEAVKGEEITDMLKTDIALEADAVGLYNEAAAICAAEKDQVSKDPSRASQGRRGASRHLREYEKPHRHAGRPLSGEPHGQVTLERGLCEAMGPKRAAQESRKMNQAEGIPLHPLF